ALSSIVTQINEPFAFLPVSIGAPEAPQASGFLLAVGWLLGCAAVVARWRLRWRRIRTDVRAASPLPISAPIPVMSSSALREPGVFGVFRPVLLLPKGIANRLKPAQLQAILAHELCHVRRRDNLAYAIHMAVEAIFWFHPLVWWIGAQL